MSTAQSIAVGPGGVPPLPAGVTVHQRGNPAPAPAPAPAPLPDFPQLEQPAPAPAPAAPAVDQTLVELLSALNTRQTPAQPAAAPAPAKPTAAPVAGQDPTINALSTVIVDGGLDFDRALGRAMADGDASLIDFAYIAEKGGEKAAQLRQVAEALVAQQEAVDARLETAVFTKFGGEANWDAAISYFAKSVPQATTDYIVGMLKTRNPALIEQASNMVLDHVKQAGATLNPAGLVNAGAAAPAAQPLGKDEFKQAIAKLNPNSPTFMQERQQLFTRRAQGKHLGR